ncbi:GNAT family N-acetyltransferase [Streptococcus plurextorum]|uniref:GNAT family N-acetyltransferase n=1 Tax=Streptococcus plurextorum TaxID=456876 RepID=UPI000429421C|nr:GNAT family protein [Streptococcus plurextorum]
MILSDLGYHLRPLEKTDAETFYQDSFTFPTPEVDDLTGSSATFTREQIVNHYLTCPDKTDRYDFVIISPDGKLIGETVINDYEPEANAANFRIAIFHKDHWGKGSGSWATKETIRYAFETVKLNRLSLEVFDFNPRAQKTYEKAGFVYEGRLRQAHKTKKGYADIILMSILAEDYWKGQL